MWPLQQFLSTNYPRRKSLDVKVNQEIYHYIISRWTNSRSINTNYPDKKIPNVYVEQNIFRHYCIVHYIIIIIYKTNIKLQNYKTKKNLANFLLLLLLLYTLTLVKFSTGKVQLTMTNPANKLPSNIFMQVAELFAHEKSLQTKLFKSFRQSCFWMACTFNDRVIYGMNLLIIATFIDKYVNNYYMSWGIPVISYCIL
jgi:hypothetical protein